jgi:hypothetical protein
LKKIRIFAIVESETQGNTIDLGAEKRHTLRNSCSSFSPRIYCFLQRSTNMNFIGYTSCERPALAEPLAGREGVKKRMKNGIVQIHGKEYMTVAKRVEMAHEDSALESIETEVISHNPVVIRARIIVKGKTFTGISSVSLDSSKLIEKQNPYEVAETSAVGRALGFAGFGLVESIASADEVLTAQQKSLQQVQGKSIRQHQDQLSEMGQLTCDLCGNPAIEKRGTTKNGKAYHGIFCSTEEKSHTRWLAVN